MRRDLRRLSLRRRFENPRLCEKERSEDPRPDVILILNKTIVMQKTSAEARLYLHPRSDNCAVILIVKVIVLCIITTVRPEIMQNLTGFYLEQIKEI